MKEAFKRVRFTPAPGSLIWYPRTPRIPSRSAALCLAIALSLLLPAAHAQKASKPAAAPLPDAPSQSLRGSITGTITDRDGAFILDATVILTREGHTPPDQQTLTGVDGRFFFPAVPAGRYTLIISATGFVPVQISGELLPGQTYEAPALALLNHTATVEVQVTATQEEIAQAQIEIEEKQRVFGIIPNFYVSYIPNAAPLSTRQKYELAWKNIIDPTSFASAGVFAAIQQAGGDFNGYGPGVAGYASRFGANYGNIVFGTLIGGAILPSILKQDPRYFYKGTGTVKQRINYALAMAVICKGDNAHWQFNYSGTLGTLAASGMSNLYYPAEDRHGVGLTFQNLATGIAGSAISNIFQEFLIPRFTPHKPPLPSNNNP